MRQANPDEKGEIIFPFGEAVGDPFSVQLAFHKKAGKTAFACLLSSEMRKKLRSREILA